MVQCVYIVTLPRYTLDIEAVSCDEMYVNLTELLKALGCTVDDFVAHIRAEISDKTQCPCSAGIGANKYAEIRNNFSSIFFFLQSD